MEFNVAVIGVNQHALWETFIRAHVEQLAARTHYVFLGPGGYCTVNGSLVSHSLFSKIMRRFPGFRLAHGPEGRLANYLKHNNIQCILAEYGPTGVNVLKICKRLGIPLIVHFHGYDASHREVLTQYAYSYKILFREASGIVVVSRKMEQDLLQMGCLPEKLVYNPCGPSGAFFALNPDLNHGYFLGVGRFVEKKAPQLTLLAFAALLKEEPAARLVLVGDGPLFGPCRWMAKSIGIEDKVVFEGGLSQEETLLRFGRAFCFVQHSVVATTGDSEGTPVAVLEAGASGLPVVTTRHAGIPDVVLEGETGFLVDEGDVEAMAAAMLRLYHDRALSARMGAAARLRVRKHFSMEKHIGILNNLVEKAVAEKIVG